MRPSMIALVALSAFAATNAAAQGANFTGEYRCVQNCAGSGPAYVTQNGWDLNLVNELGQPSRAWIDFDNGAVWQRFEPKVVLRRRY